MTTAPRSKFWPARRGLVVLAALTLATTSCGGSSDPGVDAAATSAPATAPSTPSATPDTTEPTTPPTIPTSTVGATPSSAVATDVDYGAEAAAGAPSPPRLDVWAPTDARDAPVLVTFHGVPTDRGVTAELAAGLAARGYVVVNVGWQLDDTFETGVVFQGACALRFVRENAGRWGGDPEDVTTVGYSAGGALSAVLGLNGDAITGQCANDPSISGAPDKAVALAGLFEFLDQPPGSSVQQRDPALWELLNVYEHLDQAAGSSWLLIHGDADTTVPLAWTERFSAALDANGADVETDVLAGVDHGLVAGGSPWLDSVIDLVDAWLR